MLAITAAVVSVSGCGSVVQSRPASTHTAPAPPPVPATTATTATTPVVHRPPPDPGKLPQTMARPSGTSAAFRARAVALWHGIETDSTRAALPAFFPRAAYLQVKNEPNPGADWLERLVAAYGEDITAAHNLIGRDAEFVALNVPSEMEWVPPGSCYNGVGYWHTSGRLVYRTHGVTRSIGVFSLISWRGEWYVIHFSSYEQPGTVDDPEAGVGTNGVSGGC